LNRRRVIAMTLAFESQAGDRYNLGI